MAECFVHRESFPVSPGRGRLEPEEVSGNWENKKRGENHLPSTFTRSNSVTLGGY